MSKPLYTFSPTQEHHEERQTLQTLAMLNNGYCASAAGLSLARVQAIFPQLENLGAKGSVALAFFSERHSKLRLVTLDEGIALALIEVARAEGFGSGELDDVRFEIDDLKPGEWDEDERLEVPGLLTRFYFMAALNWESISFNPDPVLALYPEHRQMWESVTSVVYRPRLGLFDPARSPYTPSANAAPAPSSQYQAAASGSSSSAQSPPRALEATSAVGDKVEGVNGAGQMIEGMDVDKDELEGEQQQEEHGGPSIDTSAVLAALDDHFSKFKMDLQTSFHPPAPASASPTTSDPLKDLPTLLHDQLDQLRTHFDTSIASLVSKSPAPASSAPVISVPNKIVVRIDNFFSEKTIDCVNLCKFHDVRGDLEAVSNYNCTPTRYAVVRFKPSEMIEAERLVRRINRDEKNRKTPTRARLWEYQGPEREVTAIMEHSTVGVTFDDRMAFSRLCEESLGFLPEAARSSGDADTGFHAVFLFRSRFEAERAVEALGGVIGRAGAWKLQMRGAEQGLDFSYVNMAKIK